MTVSFMLSQRGPGCPSQILSTRLTSLLSLAPCALVLWTDYGMRNLSVICLWSLLRPFYRSNTHHAGMPAHFMTKFEEHSTFLACYTTSQWLITEMYQTSWHYISVQGLVILFNWFRCISSLSRLFLLFYDFLGPRTACFINIFKVIFIAVPIESSSEC
jgi:hypothetical protein